MVVRPIRWSFARLEGGKAVPDPRHIFLAAGFIPGRLYHVVYTTSGAPVIGLGFLATRDFVSFLRYELARPDNPCAGRIQHAYAFGVSQSGGYLRQFLYLGLNQDERERLVFDGYLIHIAGGGRGADFNQRFGQPSNTLRPRMRETAPFTDVPQVDPVTGKRAGLLDRLGTHRRQPRIFLTNSSTEYWRGDASLIHTNAEGTQDVEPSSEVRIYHYAGTQHASATWPLTDSNPLDGSRGQSPMNTVDYRPLLRVALVRLDRWVSAEEPPPPSSRYPRLADGTAVLPESTADVFSGIPGMRFPAHLPRVARNDFGPEANRGIATTLPPLPGKPYPHFVPAIDRDGNDVAGIRLPDLTVPLATHTGWNLRHQQIGAPGLLLNLMGATVPFAAAREEKEARGDPRRSIAERYPSRDAYLEQVRQAAQHLVEEGYLLAEDLEFLVNQAGERFDVFARPSAGATT
jgi:Alpha/beta hydrolase domain